MSAQELYTGLLGAGYPVAYHQFRSAQEPPFVVYRFANSADLMADNENYQAVSDYFVELYTANKDPTAEAAVEAELKALGLTWAKEEAFIDTEDMYQILYTVRIITDESESVS